MNPERKTLLILSPGFASDEADSVCIPMQQSFVLALKKSFPLLDIIILTFQYPYHTSTYQWHGITVIPFNGRNKGGIARLLLRRKINYVMEKIFRANRITGLLSFWFGECALVGKKFAEKHQLSHFCWIIGQDAKKENKYPRRTRPRGNELIALSDFIQEFFEKNHGARPSYVIPPGIDPLAFVSPAPPKDIDIIAAGSLIPLKRFEIFIGIIAEIKKQFPSVKAVLAGEGPERKKLEELINEKGLSSSITMTGELPHPDLLQLAQRSKVLLHPSSYEAFGVVMLEALGAGASVCSFVKPMNAAIENWYIVKSKEEMIEKTISLLQDPQLYKQVIPFTAKDAAMKVAKLFSL